MVDVCSLKPGDMVKIVDEWHMGCGQNTDGKMDHWLGKTMTVRKVCKSDYFDFAKMEEDKNEGIEWLHKDGWFWYSEAIERVIDDISEEEQVCDSPSREQLSSFLFQ